LLNNIKKTESSVLSYEMMIDIRKTKLSSIWLLFLFGVDKNSPIHRVNWDSWTVFRSEQICVVSENGSTLLGRSITRISRLTEHCSYGTQVIGLFNAFVGIFTDLWHFRKDFIVCNKSCFWGSVSSIFE